MAMALGGQPLLFVGVCSHANNVERRRAIRATYLAGQQVHRKAA